MSDKEPITSQPGLKKGEYERLESEQTTVTSQPTSPHYSKFGMDTVLLTTSVDGNRDWTSGLFDCMQDKMNCALVCFCAPCVQCHLGTRIGECLCMPLFVQGALLTMRTRLRTLGGIQGSICNDCLVTALCGPCALCQMKRELDVMGVGSV
ncbi:cornifelin homolog A-like [Ruditapes philippinarum]|uniref:cornifelin homolog A-like n=1 Tax=Ruditapes philippinarum TaxID=129788 RepID=UPI00295C20C0|nr:cornifelin homolog A-like [Ruditapes philippinarum]